MTVVTVTDSTTAARAQFEQSKQLQCLQGLLAAWAAGFGHTACV
jgi:hypothetical protein